MSEKEVLEQIEILKDNPHYSTIEFQQTDTLYDTEEQVEPCENHYTIEVQADDGTILWTNKIKT